MNTEQAVAPEAPPSIEALQAARRKLRTIPGGTKELQELEGSSPPGNDCPVQPMALTLTCVKCTKWAAFPAATAAEAYAKAEHKGWKIRNGQPVCKRCPA